MKVDEVQALGTEIRNEIAKAVVGQEATVDLMLVALFAGGHMLLEGPPGTAKTLLAHSFAQRARSRFRPHPVHARSDAGDIIGANLFNFQTSSFTLTRGPIFTELLLADEINRTPPKTQAALLEAMQERQVTIDGAKPRLGDRFMVVATQNPIEQQGVYPLPEAQLDRFLFKQRVDYPSLRGGEQDHRHPRRAARRRWSLRPGASSARRTPSDRRGDHRRERGPPGRRSDRLCRRACARDARESRSRIGAIAPRRGHARGRGESARGDRRTRLRHPRRRQGACRRRCFGTG